jgi:2-oxoglutarate dehydrogenase E2 component (dihydrolipoamide succinyltransferase)
MFVTMPQLGETVTEGTVTRWCKAVGDQVAEDEPLFEVSTDKVDTEVPSALAGVLTEILVPEGDTAPVGAPLAVIRTDGEPDDAPAVPRAAAVATVPSEPPPSAPAGRAEPARGTREAAPITLGAHVTREQVEARLAARGRPLARPAPSAPPVAPATVPARPEAPPMPVAGPGDRVERFTAIRRRTADHLRRSIETAAHTLVVMQADYSAVERDRAAARDAFRTREGFGLTALPFVARAVADAVAEYPRVNASVGADGLVVHPALHLGVAVDLDFEGLVVPVVHDAGALRLPALARRLDQLRRAAHADALTPDDVTGATFTITNAGGYGTLVTAPIISQPQVAILSTDGVAMRPVAVPTPAGHGIAVHPVGNLSLSFDHRAFDGAYASAFLRRVVEQVETRRWDEELA